MKVGSLGHVVLKVSDLDRATHFYRDVLGLEVAAESGKMTFFTLGNHHDLAVVEVSDASSPAASAVGLAHVAFKIGTTLEELKEAKQHLDSNGIEPHPVDHGVTQSLYFSDPDGNGLELYVDVSDAWRKNPQLVARSGALEL